MTNEIIKIVIIGNSGVGKTSLSNRIVNDEFVHHQPTIGFDLQQKIVTVENRSFRLMIWDTAGCERFRSLTPSFYRNAHGCILVYDVTNAESLGSLKKWNDEFNVFSSKALAEKLVVGHKTDMRYRIVSPSDGENFARQIGASYVEGSSRLNTNVKESFEALIQKIVLKPGLLLKRDPGLFEQRSDASHVCC